MEHKPGPLQYLLKESRQVEKPRVNLSEQKVFEIEKQLSSWLDILERMVSTAEREYDQVLTSAQTRKCQRVTDSRTVLGDERVIDRISIPFTT